MPTARPGGLTETLLLLLAFAGCAREEPATEEPATDPWVRSRAEVDGGRRPADPGIGVVYLTRSAERGPAPRRDTLVFRAAPDARAARIGALIVEYGPDGGWSYVVAARDSLVPNLIEYGYEEAGVPIDSVAGLWVRGTLGRASNATPLRGWAHMEPGRVEHLLWSAHLTEQMLFLPDIETPLHRSPGDVGRRAREVLRDTTNYAIYPVEARGPWLRVRVVTPSECHEPDPRRRREARYWIRYLDARGRPTVWYFTRGC